jgi:hypothetical protein
MGLSGLIGLYSSMQSMNNSFQIVFSVIKTDECDVLVAGHSTAAFLSRKISLINKHVTICHCYDDCIGVNNIAEYCSSLLQDRRMFK